MHSTARECRIVGVTVRERPWTDGKLTSSPITTGGRLEEVDALGMSDHTAGPSTPRDVSQVPGRYNRRSPSQAACSAANLLLYRRRRIEVWRSACDPPERPICLLDGEEREPPVTNMTRQ